MYPNVIYFRKLTKTTTEDDLNGFVGLLKELIPVNGKLLKLSTNSYKYPILYPRRIPLMKHFFKNVPFSLVRISDQIN